MVQSVKHLPFAQVMVSGSWNQVPHGAPSWSLLLPLPVYQQSSGLGRCGAPLPGSPGHPDAGLVEEQHFAKYLPVLLMSCK